MGPYRWRGLGRQGGMHLAPDLQSDDLEVNIGYCEQYLQMDDRQRIVDEIRRVGDTLGKAPGRAAFEKLTGIRTSEWHGKFWRTWGEALNASGFSENTLQGKLSSEEVLRHYAQAIRYFGRVPAAVDVRMYSRENAEFPGHTTFNKHFGSKEGLLIALQAWASKNAGYEDILGLLPAEPTSAVNKTSTAAEREGSVYLLKSGDHYKIGRSDQLERRIKQITVSMPEKIILEHTIRTDDPSGIEAYWHRRFADKRANGEWFRLAKADVLAFKKRRFQ